MTYAIKNFSKFQHFKDRTPPWIKLYRDILDDPDWHDLPAEAAKVLVMLWVIASEDETKQGVLPEEKKLAFRLRVSEKALRIILSQLSNFVIKTDINPISNRYQSVPVADELQTATETARYQTDAPERAGEETERETETEGERETESCAVPAQRDGLMSRFERFYAEYPKKKNRGEAEKAWKALKPDEGLTEKIIAAVKVARESSDWLKEGGQYAPYPAKWLRSKGWEDEQVEQPTLAPVRYIGGMRVGKNWV